ncbi:hypothetical protein IT571_11515 [Candidatus Sumerlaeota bacterium]|nr:hypothetical protein [Candidatus Sumerlaeota bacterium]
MALMNPNRNFAMRPCTLLAVSLTIILVASSCARFKRDRCYVEETRYMEMKAIFEQTGSYQRMAQAMKDQGWAHCEINQARYRLRKDLELDDAEAEVIFNEQEPSRSGLDFNPGRVEHLPKDKVRKN